MGSTSLTAANVMDKAASLMNDTAKTVYTYAAQLPYLNMALSELEEHFQLNNIPVTAAESAVIQIPVGVSAIRPFDDGGTDPKYPQDLVEIQELSERQYGTNDAFLPILKKDILPTFYNDLNAIVAWSWTGQVIKFNASNTIREVRLNYLKSLFPEVTNAAALLGVINSKSFLQYRTAGLCTQFIGENATRATELNNFAVLALDRATGIGTKAKQVITTRRQPFMASYKRRSAT